MRIVLYAALLCALAACGGGGSSGGRNVEVSNSPLSAWPIARLEAWRSTDGVAFDFRVATVDFADIRPGDGLFLDLDLPPDHYGFYAVFTVGDERLIEADWPQSALLRLDYEAD